MVGGRAECLVRFKISRNITYFLLKELWSEQDGKGSRNVILGKYLEYREPREREREERGGEILVVTEKQRTREEG